MLQQTQVNTVIPYFERWMQQFPNLASLALANQDTVLAHWSGLGYYARARNMHKAARLCNTQHGGDLPLEPLALQALPGIGRSTANAIISQSIDTPAAILDGNVKRTLARHALVQEWTGSSAAQKVLWREAERRLPAVRGADYSQAIMDLGALVCTRRNPLCEDCPVSQDCLARQQHLVDLILVPKPKRKIRQANLAMLILIDRDENILLEKRPPSGIWGGLWAFPCGQEIEELTAALGITAQEMFRLKPRIHRLTHLEMHIEPWRGRKIDPRGVKCSASQRWISLAETSGMGLPKPVSDLIEQIEIGELE